MIFEIFSSNDKAKLVIIIVAHILVNCLIGGSYLNCIYNAKFRYTFSLIQCFRCSLLLCIIFVNKEIHDYRATVVDSLDPKLTTDVDHNTEVKTEELGSTSTTTKDVAVSDAVDNTRKNKSEESTSKKRKNYLTNKKEFGEKSNSSSEPSNPSTSISTNNVNDKQVCIF